jgi:hypothetical protein
MNLALRERAYRMALLAQKRDAERKPTPRIDPPAAGRLGDLAAPTLVMIGDQDVPFCQDVADYLAPNEFNAALLGFLQEVAASRGVAHS